MFKNKKYFKIRNKEKKNIKKIKKIKIKKNI